jgi:hypothetical protein
VNWKKILVLALLLAVLAAAIVYLDRKEKGRQASEGILLDIAADMIDRIELRNPEGFFVFSRREPLWQMEKPMAAKADKVALESILDHFSRLQYDRLVAEDSADLKAFGLDTPGIELKLFVKDQPAATVVLGVKNTLDDSSYAKLAGDGRVVSIAAYKRQDLEKGLLAFRDKKFFVLDPMAVNSLEYRNGNASVSLAKKDDRWFLEKPIYSLARESRVSELLSAASQLEAASFAPAGNAGERAAFGLDKPLLTAEFRTPSGPRRITVGRQGESHYALADGSSEVCGISGDFAGKFVADAAAWRENKVARFFAFDARKISFHQGAFRFALRKDEAGNWDFLPPRPGMKPDGEKVESLLTVLSGLEATGFIDTPDALPVVAARVAIETEDQVDPEHRSETVLEFGAAAGETVVVRDPSLPYSYRVQQETMAKLPAKIEDIAAAPSPPQAGK